VSRYQFASIPVGKRILDHEYGDSFSGMSCGAMVLRNGGGDQCGRSYKEHQGWKPWNWGTQRFHSADPEGQDFDFRPEYSPGAVKQHNPVNRILVALREMLPDDVAISSDLFVVDFWLVALSSYDLFGGQMAWEDPKHRYNIIIKATTEEREHALAVLSRLVRLYEKEIL
jgi:hypothetical protein